MRIVVYAMAAILLPACSWQGQNYFQQGSSLTGPQMNANGRYFGASAQGAANPCLPPMPNQPVMLGCAPAPGQMASGQFTTGAYGSHVLGSGYGAANYKMSKKDASMPRLRGSLSLGSEIGVSGNLVNLSSKNGSVPGDLYNPDDFKAVVVTGSTVDEVLTRSTYTAKDNTVQAKTFSYNDIYSTPLRIAGGLEYILNSNATAFTNVGYTSAAGSNNGTMEIEGDLNKDVTQTTYDAAGLVVGTPVSNSTFYPNVNIANYIFDFSDMRRFDVELGGRYYFNPLYSGGNYETITPFVSASVGAAHYNAMTAKMSQNHLQLSTAYESGLTNMQYYDVDTVGQKLELYDSQWVGTANLLGGIEWQATPRTAFALETGLRFEQGRDLSAGDKGDKIIATPVTLRGSVNF